MYRDFAALRNATDYEFLDERMMEDLPRTRRSPYRYLIVRRDFAEDGATKSAMRRILNRPGGPSILHFSKGELQDASATERLAAISRTVHPDDDFAPGIYFTRFRDHSIVFLNQRAEPVDLAKTHSRMVAASTVAPAYGLVEVRRSPTQARD
jgi:hypothetical protein